MIDTWRDSVSTPPRGRCVPNGLDPHGGLGLAVSEEISSAFCRSVLSLARLKGLLSLGA